MSAGRLSLMPRRSVSAGSGLRSSRCATCRSACTPASVRPDPMNSNALSRVAAPIALSISPCTVRAFFCFCQPLYFVPAYSMVSLYRGTHLYDTFLDRWRAGALAPADQRRLKPSLSERQYMHKPVHATNLPKPVGPYSPGMNFERLIFVSGQGATDPATGTLAGNDIERQTEQCLKNVQAILRAGGSDLQHVLRCGVFLLDMKEFQRMNAVYSRMFGEHGPPGPPSKPPACPGTDCGSKSTALPTCRRART